MLVATSAFVLTGNGALSLWRRSHPQKTTTRVLNLREIVSAPELMMAGESHLSSPFTKEFNILFELVGNILDCAVMKYVDQSVPFLSRQEAKHAALHLKTHSMREKQGEQAPRWNWLIWLFDLLFLRCSFTLGIALCVHVEAGAWAWFFLPLRLPFVRDALPNLFVFHGMEECEHGALTVQHLRARSNIGMLLLTFPLAVVAHFVLLLCPPVMLLCLHPQLLKRSSTYTSLLRYYLSFGIAFIVTVLAQIIYCLFPFSESHYVYEFQRNEYAELLKKRGVVFKVVDQASYDLNR